MTQLQRSATQRDAAEAEATNQGNSQVSSFGFGGTNAHGVFWGMNVSIKEDSSLRLAVD